MLLLLLLLLLVSAIRQAPCRTRTGRITSGTISPLCTKVGVVVVGGGVARVSTNHLMSEFKRQELLEK